MAVNDNSKLRVTITIDGPPLAGKTTIAAAITSALSIAGIGSTFEACEADIAHHDVLNAMSVEAEVLSALRHRVEVKIIELHRGRPPGPMKDIRL